MPYGPLVHIAKKKCVAHITKQMGSGLREIVNALKVSYFIIDIKGFHKSCVKK